MKTDHLKAELLAECAEDFVGLWCFPWGVREVLGVTESEEVKRIALGILEELLLSKEIVAGDLDLDQGVFLPWELSPDESFSRIKSAWTDLGREPGMLEVAWLTTPA